MVMSSYYDDDLHWISIENNVYLRVRGGTVQASMRRACNTHATSSHLYTRTSKH